MKWPLAIFRRKPSSPFPEAELRSWFLASGMTPEEYAAKRGHLIGDFSLHLYYYSDKELGRWLHRFGKIFEDPEKLEKCRRKFLSPEEFQVITKYIDDVISGRIEP
jgi:hypothetical protein